MKRTNLNKGFTLVELIVVVAVLAILAVAAVIAVTNVQRNARISTATSEARALAGAVNEFNESVIASDRITLSAGLSMSGGMIDLAFNPNTARRVSRASVSTIAAVSASRQGPLDPIDRSVNFGTPSRALTARGSWIEFNASSQLWEINEDNIRETVS